MIKRIGTHRVLTTLLALFLASTSVHAASFDCAKAATRAEKTICADPALSGMDNELAKTYAQAKEKTTDKDALTKAQRTWVKSVRDGCPDNACMMKAYVDRIAKLQLEWGRRVEPTMEYKVTLSTGTVMANAPECSKDEMIFFTCSLGSKIVSLCGSKDISKTSGYLQYRMGKKGGLPEMVYPLQPEHPSKAFRFSYEGGAKSSSTGVSFDRAGYSYSVFSTKSVYGYNGDGVIIEKNDKRISFLKCKRNTTQEDLYGLREFGIPVGSVSSIGPEE